MSVTAAMDKKANPPSAIAGKLDAWWVRMLSSRLGRVSAAIWSRAPNDATAFCASCCSMRRWSGVTALLIRFVVVGFTQWSKILFSWSMESFKYIISAWLFWFISVFCQCRICILWELDITAAWREGKTRLSLSLFCDDATHSDKSSSGWGLKDWIGCESSTSLKLLWHL